MTTEELAQVWVPVPLRWRHVIAGDVFVSRESRLWHVSLTEPRGGRISVIVESGSDDFADDVDPDDVITVLVPTLECEAVELSMDELGARLVERRTDQG